MKRLLCLLSLIVATSLVVGCSDNKGAVMPTDKVKNDNMKQDNVSSPGIKKG